MTSYSYRGVAQVRCSHYWCASVSVGHLFTVYFTPDHRGFVSLVLADISDVISDISGTTEVPMTKLCTYLDDGATSMPILFLI